MEKIIGSIAGPDADFPLVVRTHVHSCSKIPQTRVYLDDARSKKNYVSLHIDSENREIFLAGLLLRDKMRGKGYALQLVEVVFQLAEILEMDFSRTKGIRKPEIARLLTYFGFTPLETDFLVDLLPRSKYDKSSKPSAQILYDTLPASVPKECDRWFHHIPHPELRRIPASHLEPLALYTEYHLTNPQLCTERRRTIGSWERSIFLCKAKITDLLS